jgi:hypothetical protein
MPLLAGEDFPGVNLKKIDGVVLSVDRSMRVIIRLDTAVKHDSTFPPTNLIGVPLRDLIDPFKATFSVDYDTMPQRGGEKT